MCVIHDADQTGSIIYLSRFRFDQIRWNRKGAWLLLSIHHKHKLIKIINIFIFMTDFYLQHWSDQNTATDVIIPFPACFVSDRCPAPFCDIRRNDRQHSVYSFNVGCEHLIRILHVFFCQQLQSNTLSTGTVLFMCQLCDGALYWPPVDEPGQFWSPLWELSI